MEAERETVDRYVAAFLADRVGQILACRISGVQPFGFFATVEGLGGDGLVLAATLGREYFRYDEKARALVGDDSGETYRQGQKIELKLVEANPGVGLVAVRTSPGRGEGGRHATASAATACAAARGAAGQRSAGARRTSVTRAASAREPLPPPGLHCPWKSIASQSSSDRFARTASTARSPRRCAPSPAINSTATSSRSAICRCSTRTSKPRRPPNGSSFREAIAAADGVLFVTPEYNRTIPGVLKNAIDVGSRPYGESVWERKPAAIVSASPGAIGGFGANHNLRQACVFLDMPVMQQPEAYLGHVSDKSFNADGTLVDGPLKELVAKLAGAFAKWVHLIHCSRELLARDSAHNA